MVAFHYENISRKRNYFVALNLKALSAPANEPRSGDTGESCTRLVQLGDGDRGGPIKPQA
jgi:hypothetical protein